ELEERTQALTRWQEELAGREATFADTQQRLADEHEAMLAQARQIATDRQQLTAEQEQLNVAREQLAASQASNQVLNERQSQPTASANAENPSESASVSSVLSRLVKAGLWRGNEEADAAEDVVPKMGDDDLPRETASVAAIAPVKEERVSAPAPARPVAEAS